MKYFEKQVQENESDYMLKHILGPLNLGRLLKRRLLEAKAIQINGRPAYLTERVHAGDLITVDALEEAQSAIEPEELYFQVAFEDEHLLVVNKPPGMLVHPSAIERRGTLANAVNWYAKERGESYPFRPLHRLDRDTSGLLIVVKHKLALERMEKALKKREIKREYLAFAKGHWPDSLSIVDAPIGIAPDQKVKRGVMESGRSAITHVSVLQQYIKTPAAKLWLQLETGRTHQIRVHLSYHGHPIIGDSLYGSGQEYGMQRQALHAAKLTFTHPFTRVVTVLNATLPNDLIQLERDLEQ